MNLSAAPFAFVLGIVGPVLGFGVGSGVHASGVASGAAASTTSPQLVPSSLVPTPPPGVVQ